MGLNDTPLGERIHIGIFGKRNVGKSSLFNAITNQEMAVVSDVAGTTTDPVSKAMELLPLGPVVILDTPGFDDDGILGNKRIRKAMDALKKTDIVLLTISADETDISDELDFLERVKKENVPYIICINKCDIWENDNIDIVSDNESGVSGYIREALKNETLYKTSTVTKTGISELKEALSHLNVRAGNAEHKLVSDLIEAGDTVVLVVPIDESAPKGRLILPQQQVIRDLLEAGASAIVTRDTELEDTLKKFKDKPKAVITDSQAFDFVSKIVPEDIYLTSFSILMSRYKGELDTQVDGAKALNGLKDGSKILISEGCSHHRQCGDIGTIKLPAWIEKYTGKKLKYDFTSGGEFPEDVSDYDLIVHCGGCTLNEKEMKSRIRTAVESGVPITNYGVLISYMNGILERSLSLLTIRDK